MRPNPKRSIEKYRRRAKRYDQFGATLVGPIRQSAIEMLNLQPGNNVLDIACGTGINFDLILKAIGEEGRLIGIDMSPDMLAKAQGKIEREGWTNVTLIESSIENAKIPIKVDALLFSFTHDVLCSKPALENVFSHLKQGGRVVSVGMKWGPWWAVPVNLCIGYLGKRYITTFNGLRSPWTPLVGFSPNLQVKSTFFGGAYIAWG